jgi:soluble lytic murein transglycosylase-like protein
MFARLALIAAAVAVAAAALMLLLGGGQSSAERSLEVATEAAGDSDALAWEEDRRAELEQRAATGTSHVIYANSPGGVVATAERTDAWRGEVERAAERNGVDADRLEALVFLESAGRPEVIAGETPEAASGLTQIIPSTATDLLDMRVDLEQSIRLTKQLAGATADGKAGLADRLAAERAMIDERFDPKLALGGAARYLEIAAERFGATDLATVSYHMGIGNLESVIRAYAGASDSDPIGEIVAGDGLTYAQLFFDSSPLDHAEAHELLSGFGDDSSEYYWKILASERIMELWREDPDQLERIADLATAKATLEEVYHPEDETKVFADPGDVSGAADDGELLPLFDASELGWVPDAQMGELAPRLGEEPGLYRSLRPEALATLGYLAAGVERISGAERPLQMTSAVRDQSYQDLLVASNPEATQSYSLHTTGYAFDILRDYANGAQAEAFQFMLDRLQALAVIDYAVEPRAIHVTVSDLGSELVAP